MRVEYKNLILVCDWAVCHKNCIIFGTRSKEVFFVAFDSDGLAHRAMGELIGMGRLRARNIGKVRCFYIEKMSDLLCDDIFENAVFDAIPGGVTNGMYNPI